MSNNTKNKKRYLRNKLVIFIIILCSLGIVFSTSITKDKIKYEGEYLLDEFQFMSMFTNANFKGYFETLNKKSSYFNEFYKDKNISNDEDYIHNINSSFENNDDIYRDNDIVDYYMLNRNNNNVKSSIEKSKFIEKILKDKNLENIEHDNNYEANLIISYDKAGDVTICYTNRKNKVIRKYTALEFVHTYSNMFHDENFEYKPIKNAIFIYSIDDILEFISKNHVYIPIDSTQYNYLNIATLVILFISFITKYKRENEGKFIRKLLDIPFEINIFIIAFISVIGSSMFGSYLYDINYSEVNNIDKNSIILAYIISFILSFIYLYVAHYTVTLIKEIFRYNFKKYVKEKVLIVKGVRSIIKYIKEIDFKDKLERKILLIALIDFIAISLICSMWVFGIFVSIIYTVAIYILIKKYFLKISNYYNKLLSYTNEIKEGNFNYYIEEDLNIFKPIKEEIFKVKDGFQNALNNELESQKMKVELISNVSHDLKTPLTSIINYTELLKYENLDYKTQKEYIDTLDRKSKRLKTLIEDLFDVSNVKGKNVKLNIEEVNVIGLINYTLLELEDKINKSSLIFSLNFEEDEVILNLDRKRTIRVFENLIVNITKYSLENTRVYIDTRKENNKFYITLRNISKEEIDVDGEYLLERFVRGDKSRNTEGSGLGLSIAKDFIELQGGNLSANIDGDLFKVIIEFNI
ncbi:HAMP domain-containing sensor histidine kinase [Clostridium baratii]|uniref:HAMP domain-containing sensor histidine kinase n=1 Tax=Clostridium baratii TaxID=1561 RepID=UPI002A765CD8|nr:HAMP domain-containing sensor histidine kinase [Clostridium baratii]MDY3208164.1 HAMP domain-containing sensor histidine kinase [Clostridium baratii]